MMNGKLVDMVYLEDNPLLTGEIERLINNEIINIGGI